MGPIIYEGSQSIFGPIPWRGMMALRNILIHDYEAVDINRVWQVVENNLPILKMEIEKILPPLTQLESELAEGKNQANL